MMKKTVSAGAAATVLLGLGVLAPAGADATTPVARPTGSSVTAKQLPGLAQVAKIAPELANGLRVVDRAKRVEGPGKTCRAESSTKAASGRSALYMPKDFTGEGATDMLVYLEVFEMKTKKDATKVAGSYRRFAKLCSGKQLDGATISRLALPKIGQQRAAMRMTADDGYEGALTIVRRGRTVVITTVGDGQVVKRADAVALTRLAFRTATT